MPCGRCNPSTELDPPRMPTGFVDADDTGTGTRGFAIGPANRYLSAIAVMELRHGYFELDAVDNPKDR